MFLIIGSQGLLGRHSAAYFRDRDMAFICVSHKSSADIYLDLQKSNVDLVDTVPCGITHALFCSSITDIEACRRDPAGTWRFNVTNTINVLQVLLAQGIQPIFCSSDLVFAGDEGDYREDCPRYPTTEYGRQKKAVEDFLINQEMSFLIIRMSKLYTHASDDPSPIGATLNTLDKGLPIRCADDQVICPTYVGDIPHVINLLTQCGANGIYHVSAPRRYTRYTLGMAIAESVGMAHLVQRCSIKDFDFVEPRPTNNSLNISKLMSTINMTFTNIEQYIPYILNARAELLEVKDSEGEQVSPEKQET